MGGQVCADTISGVSGEALVKYRLLKLTGDRTFKYAQPGDVPIGSNEAACAADADISIHLLGRLGSIELMADGAIAQNARVYVGLNGYVSAAAVGPCLGIALEAATAQGDVIEVLPQPWAGHEALPDAFELFDDFFAFDTTEGPFDTTGDAGAGGASDVEDGVGGVMRVTADGDDNDEMYLHSIVEAFKFANGKPIVFEARAAVVEGAANKAAFILGLLSAAGANALVDDEGGPPANYSGVVFYKVSGGLVLSAEVSVGATQTAIALSPDASKTLVSGTYKVFRIVVVPTSDTLMNVYLFIDGVLVGTATGVTYTGATEMDCIVGVKSDGSAEEAALIDYIRCRQAR